MPQLHLVFVIGTQVCMRVGVRLGESNAHRVLRDAVERIDKGAGGYTNEYYLRLSSPPIVMLQSSSLSMYAPQS